jgi:hypothetical protein
MNRNSPLDNRTFNYVYKITNIVNDKIYIGVHRTDNLNDNYMGSGKILKRSINKYGIENFKKEIIKKFKTYKEALEYEKQLVTPSFIEQKTNYNIKEGGFGSCKWSSEAINHLSIMGKRRYKNEHFKKLMNERVYKNEERNKKIGEGVRKWIENNQQKHKNRMDKINKNPDKIYKTSLKHINTKRSETACKNILQGLKNAYEKDPELVHKISGKGSMYIYCEKTDTVKRINKNDAVHDGWVRGSRPMKNKRNYNICNGLVFAYNPDTLETHRYKNINVIPTGYIRGRPKNGRSNKI